MNPCANFHMFSYCSILYYTGESPELAPLHQIINSMVEAFKVWNLVKVFCTHGRQSHQTEAGGCEIIALGHGAMGRRRAAALADIQRFRRGFPVGGFGQATRAPVFFGVAAQRVHELSQSRS